MELGRCLSGSGVAVVNQRILPFSPGDVLLVWPGQFHMAWTIQGFSEWNFLNFDAAAVPLDASLPLPPLPGSPTIEQSGFNQVLASSTRPEASQIVSLVFHELQRGQPGFESAVRSLLSTLVVWLRRELRSMHSSVETSRRSEDLIVRLGPALTRMASSYSLVLNIRELAQLCFMSERTFRRSFHTALGQSPLEYMLRLRMNSASALLSTTSLSIKEIAARTGFSSPSDFSRTFRKFTRSAPNDYRKKHWGKSQAQT
jgi:AraC-like DNA-binding protein